VSTTPDRLIESLRGVNAALNPRLAYALQWEYRVLIAAPGPPVTIDCEVVDPETAAVLPRQLVGLQLWPGPSGIVAVPQPGTIVRVGFTNGDPAKPTVQGLDPSATPLLIMGFVSTVLRLGDQSAAPLTPAAWGAALTVALSVFATGLNPTTLAGQAATLVSALAALPPGATTKVFGT
jgi:hypothetical protein